MSYMKDKIVALRDLGRQVRALRLASPLTTSEIASRSGRSRDVLNRLEKGEDVSVTSLLAILYALGHRIELRPTGRPSLEEMRNRFALADEDADKTEDDGASEDDSSPPPSSALRRQPRRRSNA